MTTSNGVLLEYPPAVASRFGTAIPFGGGWGLRMARPRAVLRALESREAAGLTTVLWVHPWEIDDAPPRISLPAGKRFAHYFRLRGFGRRLEAILKSATFGPVESMTPAWPT